MRLSFDVQASSMAWFVVRMRQGALTPFQVRVRAIARQGAPDAVEVEAWCKVLDMMRDDATRIDFCLDWRPFSTILDGRPQGPPLSKVPHGLSLT
jgi:hypothetical protein